MTRIWRPSFKLVLLSVLIVGGLFLWVRKTFFPPTLEDSATRYLSCVQSSNTGCVMDYMLPEERDALHVTPQALSSLLANYVNPTLYGASNPIITKAPRADQGSYSISYRYEREGKAPLALATTVVATPQGARVPDLVKDLVLLTMFDKYRRSVTEPKLLSFIRGLRKDAGTLSRLGFTGFYDPSTKTIISWSSSEAVLERKALNHGFSSKDFD